MFTQFHKKLNIMALFTAVIIAAAIIFHRDFLSLALNNIWINGIIIGATVFGIGLCFIMIFKLVPEYNWMRRFFANKTAPDDLPPGILKPVAIMLNKQKMGLSSGVIENYLGIILNRFEDGRDSLRYITNTLIFLGLLGTFWGLINTVGGFADLITALDFANENVMESMQTGLSVPMAGMSVAFSCSLLGLGGSLIVGFLALQLQLAQNALFRELEENLSSRMNNGTDCDIKLQTAASDLADAVIRLETVVKKIS